MEATKVAQLTALNRNSVNLYFRHFRERIAVSSCVRANFRRR
jgi:hypothetical protein